MAVFVRKAVDTGENASTSGAIREAIRESKERRAGQYLTLYRMRSSASFMVGGGSTAE